MRSAATNEDKLREQIIQSIENLVKSSAKSNEFKGDPGLLKEIKIQYDVLSKDNQKIIEEYIKFKMFEKPVPKKDITAACAGVGAVVVPLIDAFTATNVTPLRIMADAALGVFSGGTVGMLSRVFTGAAFSSINTRPYHALAVCLGLRGDFSRVPDTLSGSVMSEKDNAEHEAQPLNMEMRKRQRRQ